MYWKCRENQKSILYKNDDKRYGSQLEPFLRPLPHLRFATLHGSCITCLDMFPIPHIKSNVLLKYEATKETRRFYCEEL